jgi:NADPH2:quinone reductase
VSVDVEPAEGELLVQPRACGLNRADLNEYRAGGSFPGRELAGEVVALGRGVTDWAVGDRVMARGAGRSAAPVAVPASLAMRVPESFSWAEAGALPVALMTMHDALSTRGRLSVAGRVLIHAATSGVGVTGVQLAALLGASVVFATSRSSAKLDVLRRHVGDLPCELVGIDTSTTPFESVAADLDVIVDNVGASVLPGNIAAAAVTGRIVQVGRLGGRAAEIDLEELARKRIELIGVSFRTRSQADVAAIVGRVVTEVGPQMESVRPRIARTYPMSKWQTAFEDLARNDHVGKLVLADHEDA